MKFERCLRNRGRRFCFSLFLPSRLNLTSMDKATDAALKAILKRIGA
jgi:hypothetical protein